MNTAVAKNVTNATLTVMKREVCSACSFLSKAGRDGCVDSWLLALECIVQGCIVVICIWIS